MKASELIDQLQKIVADYGNIDVVIEVSDNDTSIYVEDIEQIEVDNDTIYLTNEK